MITWFTTKWPSNKPDENLKKKVTQFSEKKKKDLYVGSFFLYNTIIPLEPTKLVTLNCVFW